MDEERRGRRELVPGHSDPWWTDRYARANDGISVEEQEGDPNSLLSFYRRLLSLRRAQAELVSGDARVLGTDQPSVLAVLRSTNEQASLLLVNLGDSAIRAAVPPGDLPAVLSGSELNDLLSDRTERRAGQVLSVQLAPLGSSCCPANQQSYA